MFPFLSAAQPTDQGEKSVVLLVGFVVVVVVGFGGQDNTENKPKMR